MSEDNSAGFGLLGFLIGMVIAGGCYFAVTMAMGASLKTATIMLIVAAIIGAVYSAIAFASKVYRIGFFSILGYLLDMSWSLLNTLAGVLVWIPACKISGANFAAPDDNSRRSGTFAYDKNPRGGGYSATTIGTVIGGGWSSHEEIHVWQARIFGPVYMLAYITSLILNLIFRLFTGNFKDFSMEAYYRIPFEDWAYWAGKTSGADIEGGWWLLGFLLTSIYVAALISIPVGIATGNTFLWVASVMLLAFYSLCRTFAPSGHEPKTS